MTDQTGTLLYLLLLLVAVTAFALPRGREGFGKLARQAGSWLLIFAAVILGAGIWQDIRGDIPAQTYAGAAVEIPRARDGHYHLVLELNGAPVRFIVDTGATDMVLSEADARRAGIDPADVTFTGFAQTANGTVRTGDVRLDEVRLGPIVDRGVRAAVTDGEMPGSLLGMRYLDRFERISIEDGRMVLER